MSGWSPEEWGTFGPPPPTTVDDEGFEPPDVDDTHIERT